MFPPNLWSNTIEYDICNSRERQVAALGFLKDWVIAVVGLETAALAALGAFVTVGDVPELDTITIGALLSPLFFLLVGLVLGMQTLFMLPASAQRVPNK